jgi:hypothetical protein
MGCYEENPGRKMEKEIEIPPGSPLDLLDFFQWSLKTEETSGTI